MGQMTLTTILGAMSVVVALEAVWLQKKINSNKYFGWLAKEPATSILKGVYFAGFPAAALIGGLVPARFFGLKGAEAGSLFALSGSGAEIITGIIAQFGRTLRIWMPDFGPLVAAATLLGGLFFLYFGIYLAMLNSAGTGEKRILRIYSSPVDLLFDGLHWSFYRAAAWLVLGNLYLGVAGGLAIILVEYALVSRVGNFSVAWQQQYALRFMLGLVTSVAFFFAPNLWLSLGFLCVLVVFSLVPRQGAAAKLAA